MKAYYYGHYLFKKLDHKYGQFSTLIIFNPTGRFFA